MHLEKNMNEFQLQILDHYKNPRNWGEPSWEPTHTASVSNTSCGDELTLYLLIKGDKIEKVAFSGRGCSISIASASLLGEAILGKEINDSLKKADEEEILKNIGIELTTSRQKCALLAGKAVEKTVN